MCFHTCPTPNHRACVLRTATIQLLDAVPLPLSVKPGKQQRTTFGSLRAFHAWMELSVGTGVDRDATQLVKTSLRREQFKEIRGRFEAHVNV